MHLYNYHSNSFYEKNYIYGASAYGVNHVRVIDDIAYNYQGNGQIIWTYNLTDGNSTGYDHIINTVL